MGSAANLNIHRHCLVLDGLYRSGTVGAQVFTEVPAPTDEALQAVLHKTITRTTQAAHPSEALVEEAGSNYLADNIIDGDSDEARAIRPLQAAAWPCRLRRASVRVRPTASPSDHEPGRRC